MRYRFTVRYLRAVYATFSGFVAALELRAIFHPGKGGLGLRIFAAVFVLALSFMVVRGLRCATLIATDDGVVYRSLLRTRSWPWSRIKEFEASDTNVGVLAWRRRVLYVRQEDGTRHKLEELNARPARSPNPVDEAVVRLNGLVASNNRR